MKWFMSSFYLLWELNCVRSSVIQLFVIGTKGEKGYMHTIQELLVLVLKKSTWSFKERKGDKHSHCADESWEKQGFVRRKKIGEDKFKEQIYKQ